MTVSIRCNDPTSNPKGWTRSSPPTCPSLFWLVLSENKFIKLALGNEFVPLGKRFVVFPASPYFALLWPSSLGFLSSSAPSQELCSPESSFAQSFRLRSPGKWSVSTFTRTRWTQRQCKPLHPEASAPSSSGKRDPWPWLSSHFRVLVQ